MKDILTHCHKSICRCYTAFVPQILSARISVSHCWLQDPFIFNLNYTDDSGGMMKIQLKWKPVEK